MTGATAEVEVSGSMGGWSRRKVPVLVVVALLVWCVSAFGPAARAAAATHDCGFASAGTGTYARTLCWFDLSGYDAAEATSAAGQRLTFALPGGYRLAVTLKVSGGPVAANRLPTYSAAYLGNSGHYTGVPGRPALYQTSFGSTTVAALTDIVATDSTGAVVQGYALVGADAESTDAGESIEWTSSSRLESLTATGTDPGIGNACGGAYTGIGTRTVRCTGRTGANKTGTAIISAEDPTSFSQRMVGGGRQAVGFGVLVSSLQLTKKVVRGFPGDSFAVSVAAPGGSVLGAADTGGGTSASTGEVTVLAGARGGDYTLRETATSGLESNYDRAWSCTRNGESDGELPTGDAGGSARVHVGIGDFVSCTVTNTAKPATLKLEKHAAAPVDVNRNGITDAGDTIGYTFTVTNTGALELHDITVTDAKAGSVACPRPSLAPGESQTCTARAPYVVSPADENSGAAVNTATASGLPPGSATRVTSDPSSTRTPTAKPAPALTLKKSVSPDNPDAYTAGRPITYSFRVTNTGNVPLNEVGVDETAFSGSGVLSTTLCPVATLAPGASTTCTATYVLTQADVDAGRLDNTATAHGKQPGSTVPTTSNPSSVSIPTPAHPAITLVKTADPTTVDRAGQPVGYTFLVTNTGDVTLRNVGVAETRFTGSGPEPVVSCPSGALAPGAARTCRATYPVTQADIDAGAVENTAVAHGTAPRAAEPTTSAPSSAKVIVTRAAALTLAKSADPATVASVGEPVRYSFTLRNTGNVTLTGVAVTEGAFSGRGTLSPVACPAGSEVLAPGQVVTCTADYAVTQADLDAGRITNSATAAGTPPAGLPAVTTPPATAVVTAGGGPALTLVKSAEPATVAGAGEAVTYRFAVTNTGNRTLTSVAVLETAFSGSGPAPVVECPSRTLAPGQAQTCTAAYTLTQSDADAGAVTNTAEATGTGPGGEPVTSSPSQAKVTVPGKPGLSLVKSADPADDGHFRAGQAVTYTFVVTNTGNRTLTAVEVRETAFSGTGRLSPPACPGGGATVARLAPGEQAICTAGYVLTQSDVDAGKVVNTAVATGTPPEGEPPVSDPSTVVVPTPPDAALGLAKTASPETVSAAGQEVAYSFVVTNTGNVTLTALSVRETHFTGSGGPPAPVCPAGALAPGQHVTCTATYRVTQSDVDAGRIDNTAVAAGTPPSGGPPVESAPASAAVRITAAAALTITKAARPIDVNGDGSIGAGDRIEWTITITNTGAVTVREIRVDDPSAGAVTCPAKALAPGQAMTCTVPAHTVTAADVATGRVRNVATAAGTGSDGSAVPAGQAVADVPVTPAPAPAPARSPHRLPDTGMDVGRLLGLSGVLLLAGAALCAAVRRRDAGR
ncbi:CshA/CshB family fibrillar adhesin-related protein [Amycolatopsis sp. NPDC049159]|uniref:CshA/CshB family fibrillar adhesin-related protein n=1 Tax=Amycolatopsis sp. NPDC049159 TaxID=3157210 RepID=UPI0033DB5248